MTLPYSSFSMRMTMTCEIGDPAGVDLEAVEVVEDVEVAEDVPVNGEIRCVEEEVGAAELVVVGELRGGLRT